MGKRPETHFHPCPSVSIRGFSNSIAEVRFIGAEGKSGGGPPHSKTLARSRGCRDNAKRIGVRLPGRFEGGWWGAAKRQKLKLGKLKAEMGTGGGRWLTGLREAWAGAKEVSRLRLASAVHDAFGFATTARTEVLADGHAPCRQKKIVGAVGLDGIITVAGWKAGRRLRVMVGSESQKLKWGKLKAEI